MGAQKYLVDAKPYLPDGTEQFSPDDLIDIYDQQSERWLQIPLSLLSSRLKQDIYSTKNVGGISEGDTLVAGTDLEDIFLKMLTVEEPPTYQAPTASLSSNYSNNQQVEAGTVLSVNLTATFTQRDGGSSTGSRFYKDGAEIGQALNTPYTLNGIAHNLTDANVVFQAQIDYDQGPVKNTNLGNPDPNGQIPAGTAVSNTRTVQSIRRGFYGVSLPSSSSAEIRDLGNAVNNPANNTQFTISIPSGATSVIFAYPASLPAVESVKYVEGLNAEVKDIFTETSVNVEGANGFNPIAYRVYRYEPANPFDSAATYNVRI